jgi:DNA polymerase I-like protein with 3'-5' exonuclease and polymerase domains
MIQWDPNALVSALKTAPLAVFDFETSSLRPREAIIAGLGILIPENESVFYVNVGHTTADPNFPIVPVRQLIDALQPFLSDPERTAVFHNSTYDLRCFFRMGINKITCQCADSLVLSHRVDENIHSDNLEPTTHRGLGEEPLTYGLKQLTFAYYGERPPTIMDATGGMSTITAPVSNVAQYCAADLRNTWRLYQRAMQIISQSESLLDLVRMIDNPSNLIVSEMMWEGIQVDLDECVRQEMGYLERIQKCRDTIWSELQFRDPIETPNQIVSALKRLKVEAKMKYDPFSPEIETDERGNVLFYRKVSIKKDYLLEVFDRAGDTRAQRVIALFLMKQLMQQRISAFLNKLPDMASRTAGRLYAERFSSTLTSTRYSSSPNLQNLPGKADDSDDDKRWQILVPDDASEIETTRNIFIAKPGYTLVAADLTAAEPRYLSLIFQRALLERDGDLQRRRSELNALRRERYPALLDAMYRGRDPAMIPEKEGMGWPSYVEDPLYSVFKRGVPFNDPYDALLATIDREGYDAAQDKQKWLRDKNNRARGKKAFLALAYGSQARTLAPKLGWSEERTQQAINVLEETYATLKPLRELTMQEIIHTGEVYSLWNRPRRINGYYQLARPNPVRVSFYRLVPTPRTYIAEIIPLGTLSNGISAFVRRCLITDEFENEGTVVLEGNPDGTVRSANKRDPLVNPSLYRYKDHINKIPFRVIGFSQTNWVEEINPNGTTGPRHYLPTQERARRQAFNSRCQVTGADHLRWLMINIRQEVCQKPQFADCKLVLTIHDSLLYEVPHGLEKDFIKAIDPIMTRQPEWCDFNVKVKYEYGERFGDMTETDA